MIYENDKKIEDIEEFRLIRNEEGFVIVTSSDSIKLHKINCSYITERNFLLKLKTKGKKGGYYYSLEKDSLLEKFVDFKDCKYCNPLAVKLRFE